MDRDDENPYSPPQSGLSQLVYSIVGARFIRMYGEPLSLFGRRKRIIDAA